MIVLGIDPGSRHMGWGVLEVLGTRITHVAHGIVHAEEGAPLVDRLLDIDDGVREVIARYSPNEAGIESIFFAKDASAAAKLGHARGVILLALRRGNVATHEYAPALVKRAVGASGRADKAQVARMVQAVLRLKVLPKADAADALAIALTHVQSAPARAIAALARR
ncbi:MAG: crossover junction endodeoxyribonuclease RuvC [Polyangiales bacterium]